MANPRRVEYGSKEYLNLTAVASMLTAVSPNDAVYKVEDVYFDYGQDWMWTTICRRGFRECQILSPRQWAAVVFADDVSDIVEAIEDIRNDKYFGDR